MISEGRMPVSKANRIAVAKDSNDAVPVERRILRSSGVSLSSLEGPWDISQAL